MISMHPIIKTLSLATAALGLCPLSQAQWVEIPDVFPAFSAGVIEWGTAGAPSSLPVGKWKVNYSETDWQSEWNAGATAGKANTLMISAGKAVVDDGWDYETIRASTNAATRFELTEAQIDSASQVRVSFTLTQITLLQIGIDTSDWDEGGEIPIGRSGTFSSSFHTLFDCYLVRASDNRTIFSEQGEWDIAFTGGAGGEMEFSFILSGDDLYAGQGGYALHIDANYALSGPDGVESFLLGDLKVERDVTPIPEPCGALLALTGLAACVIRRRQF